MSQFEKKIEELGLKVPSLTKPLAAYVHGVQADKLLFTSGQLPTVEGKLVCEGHVGAEVSIEQGYEAAKVCALNCLAVIKSIAGDLDKVERIVKLTGFVSSAPGFTAQPKVVNGASEFLLSVFGEKGEHARSAVGVIELPINAPVEVEMIVKLK